MKEKIKKILILASLFIVLGIYFGLSAKSDYSWDKKYIKQKERDWVVFSVQSNLIDILHPYTWFKQPVSRLELVEKNSLKQVSTNVFYVKQLWVNKNRGIKEETFEFLLDCNIYQTGWEREGEIEWFKPESEEAIKSYKKECEVIKDILDKNI